MIIRHEKFMDVAVKISKPVIYTQSLLVLRGTWINMGYVDTFNMGIPATIKIKKSELVQWLVCLDETKQCIRFAEWKKLHSRSFLK